MKYSNLRRYICILTCMVLMLFATACGGTSDASYGSSSYNEGAEVLSLAAEGTSAVSLAADGKNAVSSIQDGTNADGGAATKHLDENGSYTSKEQVAAFIREYGRLPSNFIKKAEAQKLGWSGGSLEPYAPGKSIGGDRFGNYEGKLPAASGRTYTECDIDTLGKSSRGSKRLVFSNDGLIYYTDDHYETFSLVD